MNCKPGDLAIVVMAYIPENVGTIVKVLPEMDFGPDGVEWLTESSRPTRTVWDYDPTWEGDADKIAWVADAWLRPITPPEDSVSDEEVRDLYAPKQTEAA